VDPHEIDSNGLFDGRRGVTADVSQPVLLELFKALIADEEIGDAERARCIGSCRGDERDARCSRSCRTTAPRTSTR
jgi:hypothetical protein